MKGRPIYFSKSQLFIFWTAIFGFLAITAVVAMAQTPNLQIDPTKGPKPYCLTPWHATASVCNENGNSHPSEICYGESSGRCQEAADVFNSGRARYDGHPLETVWVVSGNPCRWANRARESMYCPALSSFVNLSTSAGNINESGSFSVTWSASNSSVGEELGPPVKCTIEGKDPQTGNFSENSRSGTKKFTFAPRGIYKYTLTCEGLIDNSKSVQVGKVSREVLVYVGNIPPAPTITLKVNPPSIKIGESAMLSWTSENVVAVSINQGVGVVAQSGSVKVSPKFTTRYTITAAGEFADLGLARYSANLSVSAAASTPGEVAPPVEVPPDVVVAPPVVVEPEVGLLINGQKGPLTIGAPANITLSWKANQYCIAYGSWLGIKSKAGEERRALTGAGSYSYKLYCPGLGSEEVKVVITGAGGGGGGGGGVIALPSAEASISLDNNNFKKSIHVTRGKATHLWLGAGYDVNGDGRVSRDADGGWSASMTNGGTCEWNYDLNQGAAIFDVAVGDPKSAKDCTVDLGQVTFYDQPGVYAYGVLRLTQADGKVSSISSINIAVDAPPPPDTAPVIDLQVNGMKDRVLLGAPAVYSVDWSVRNADTCSASDDWNGDKFLAGSQQFASSVKRDLIYTLTCIGKLGTTTNSILVKVAELPVCEFSALPTTLNKSSVFERESVLTWKCQFSNTCSINPSTGVSTGTFGSVRVSPSDTTKYTLTCQNLDGSSSFDQTVELK